MGTRAEEQKKRERGYLVHAFGQLGVPLDDFDECERPDFMINVDQKKVGVEVVEVRDEALAEAVAGLGYLRQAIEAEMVARSMLAWISLSLTDGGATLLDMSKNGLHQAAKTIVETVRHRVAGGQSRGTIEGISLDRLELAFLPNRIDFWMSGTRRAITARQGMGSRRRLIEGAIREKEKKLAVYRQSGAAEVWLLVVGSAGGGGAIDIHDAEGSFVTAFDKVIFLELYEGKCVVLDTRCC